MILRANQAGDGWIKNRLRKRLFRHPTSDEFYASLPHDCQLIGVEFPHDGAKPLAEFTLPERCIFLLRAEDNGLSKRAVEKRHRFVYIPSLMGRNV